MAGLRWSEHDGRSVGNSRSLWLLPARLITTTAKLWMIKSLAGVPVNGHSQEFLNHAKRQSSGAKISSASPTKAATEIGTAWLTTVCLR